MSSPSKYDLGALGANRKADPRDLKISNLTNAVNSLKEELRKALALANSNYHELNKLKNEIGSMRKKMKSDIQSVASKINTSH